MHTYGTFAIKSIVDHFGFWKAHLRGAAAAAAIVVVVVQTKDRINLVAFPYFSGPSVSSQNRLAKIDREATYKQAGISKL